MGELTLSRGELTFWPVEVQNSKGEAEEWEGEHTFSVGEAQISRGEDTLGMGDTRKGDREPNLWGWAALPACLGASLRARRPRGLDTPVPQAPADRSVRPTDLERKASNPAQSDAEDSVSPRLKKRKPAAVKKPAARTRQPMRKARTWPPCRSKLGNPSTLEIPTDNEAVEPLAR